MCIFVVTPSEYIQKPLSYVIRIKQKCCSFFLGKTSRKNRFYCCWSCTWIRSILRENNRRWVGFGDDRRTQNCVFVYHAADLTLNLQTWCYCFLSFAEESQKKAREINKQMALTFHLHRMVNIIFMFSQLQTAILHTLLHVLIEKINLVNSFFFSSADFIEW